MLKKRFVPLLAFTFILFNLGNNIYADENNAYELSKYLKSLNKFKCDFIQANPDGSLSEGEMTYYEKKIKIIYQKPTKITFISKNNKAMYFNEDLMEVEYFSPDKTALKFFEMIFNLSNLSDESYTLVGRNDLIEITLHNMEIEEISEFKVIFQNKPIALKKVFWKTEGGGSVFSIFNINKGIVIDKKTFSMVNPLARTLN